MRDDLPPPEDRPVPPRGYDKRSEVPALDPRRLFEIGDQQLRVTVEQVTSAVARDHSPAKP